MAETEALYEWFSLDTLIFYQRETVNTQCLNRTLFEPPSEFDNIKPI